jgi:acylphosphatase
VQERLHAVVHGDVQGVGFRDFVRRRAGELGLAGWVRNRPDGSVECVAEGESRALEELVARLRNGPGMAEVARVEAERGAAQGGLDGFEIRF